MKPERITPSVRLVEIVTVDGELHRYRGRFRALSHLERHGAVIRIVERTLARTRIVGRFLAVDVSAVRLDGRTVLADFGSD